MNTEKSKNIGGRDGGEGKYQLIIPIDASRIPDRPKDVELRVVARDRAGGLRTQAVGLDEKGHGEATLDFEAEPGPLQVYVGPADAVPEELTHLQTLDFPVSPRLWAGKRQITLRPVLVPAYHWHWWLRWCRKFVIRGRVLCPNGKPVPGAQVCAYDIDWFFFWSSSQLVGCDTTDTSGAFEIRFKWCCGWWPWWWLRRRIWKLDPILGAEIGDLVRRNPGLILGPIGGDLPTTAVFRSLVGTEGLGALDRIVASDVSALDRLREQLLPKLPAVPICERLRIWPWYPWRPWWDCTPDIIFKVTQNCLTHVATIVDEGVGDTRVNIPEVLDVTLIANDQACCLPNPCPNPPCEGGECIIIDRVCEYNIDQVGGNLGAAAAPAGYLNPGPVPLDTAGYHRPFAGIVPVYKNPGDLIGVDYLEFEYSEDGGVTWNPLPAGTGVNFARRYWDSVASPPSVPANFEFDSVSFPGHTVLETREHREGVIGGTWDFFGADHLWLSLNWELLIAIDSTKFADGTYRFHAIGWNDGGGGTLVNRRILPVCSETAQDNELILRFDNRAITVPGLHDPTHLCGGIHICTVEPDTHILAVRINGTLVGPCDTVDSTTGTLEIDFLVQDTAAVAGDPRHLASYSLETRWGLNQSRNLLSRPGVAVAVISGGPTGWAAGQGTGNYGTALSQGAVAPDWEGGVFRLTMPVEEAFPEPCCYQLHLAASKRTLAGGMVSSGAFVCGGDFPHWNRTQFAIGVGVCGNDRPAVTLSRAARQALSASGEATG